jgi:hypothetical protein
MAYHGSIKHADVNSYFNMQDCWSACLMMFSFSMPVTQSNMCLQAVDPRVSCTCLLQVIVAHRLSTIMDADQILVLAKGQVVESGSHATLVAAGCLYASMWARQQDSSSSSVAPSPRPPAGSSSSSRHELTSPGRNENELNHSSVGGNGSTKQQQDGSRVTQQHCEVEELPTGQQVAAGDGSIRTSEPGSTQGMQSPPAGLPPVPRAQRQLRMQQRGSTDGAQQPPGAPGSSTSNASTGAAAAAAGDAAAGAADANADADAADGPTRPRSASKMRCNSSCGHGRHANFWSRVSSRRSQSKLIHAFLTMMSAKPFRAACNSCTACALLLHCSRAR